jgi:hypothetical protein
MERSNWGGCYHWTVEPQKKKKKELFDPVFGKPVERN